MNGRQVGCRRSEAEAESILAVTDDDKREDRDEGKDGVVMTVEED